MTSHGIKNQKKHANCLEKICLIVTTIGKKLLYKSVAYNDLVHLSNLVYYFLVTIRESLEGGGINDSLVIHLNRERCKDHRS